jgi:DNA-binding phage protein
MHKKITNRNRADAPAVGADDYSAQLIEDLKDPVEATAYLEAALEERGREALLVAMRNVAAAHGGTTAIAQQAALSATIKKSNL